MFKKFKYFPYLILQDEILSYIFHHDEVSSLVSSDDREIRKSIAQLLSFVLQHCAADKYPELSDVITQFLSYISKCRDDESYNMQDILIVVDALIDTFKVSCVLVFLLSSIWWMTLRELTLANTNFGEWPKWSLFLILARTNFGKSKNEDKKLKIKIK